MIRIGLKSINKTIFNSNISKCIYSARIKYYSSGSNEESNDHPTTKPKITEKKKKKQSIISILNNEKADQAKESLESLLKSLAAFTPDQTQTAFKLEKQAGTKLKELRKQKVDAVFLGNQMMSAIRDVAQTLPSDPSQTESELIQRLTGLAKNLIEEKQKSMNEVLKGMKIEVEDKRLSESIMNMGNQNRDYEDRRDWKNEPRKMQARTNLGPKVGLMAATPLKVFDWKSRDDETPREEAHLQIWHALIEEENKLFIAQAPANGFEEMIKWTEQGKLWKFPIDNEQGLDEEAQTGYEEHVFLEPLIEEGFPKQGPIRHFMELVVTGLSMNPYISVQRKHNHINWFREYFESKRFMIKEIL